MLTEELLRMAVEEGNVEAFTKIIANSDTESILAVDNKRRTLAHLAARFNQPAILAKLITVVEKFGESGQAILEQTDNEGFTPLECSYLYSAPEITGLLRAKTQLYSGKRALLTGRNRPFEQFFSRLGEEKRIPAAFFAIILCGLPVLESITKFQNENEIISSQTSEGWSLLHFLVFNHKIDVIKYLSDKYKNELNAEIRDHDGNTPFLIAAERYHPDVLNFLLEVGCDIHAKNNQGQNAISIGAKRGQLELVKVLSAKGVDLNSSDENGENALMLAARHGHGDVVAFLRTQGVSLDAKDKEGKSAFQKALDSGHLDIANLLMDTVSLEEKNEALIKAVTTANLANVKWLIDKGASPAIVDAHGDSLLMLAAVGDASFVEYLLSLPETLINHKNNDGDNALFVAIRQGRQKVVECLLKHDFNPPQHNALGQTPLLAAAKSNDAALIELFAKQGYSLEDQDKEGNTALHLAFTSNQLGTAPDYLLSHSPQLVSVTNHRKETPLHCAIIHGHTAYLPELVMHSDLESRDSLGNTPLLTAVAARDFKATELLLKQGADVLAKNDKEETVTNITGLHHFPEDIQRQLLGAYKIDYDEFQYRRRLYFIFGGEKLNEVLAFPQGKVKLGAGTFDEGIGILRTHLKNFLLERHPELSTRFEGLLNALDKVEFTDTPSRILARLESESVTFQATGFTGHLILAALAKQGDGNVKLSLAERGARVSDAPLLHSESKKFSSVRTIIILKEKCQEVVELLHNAKTEPQGVALDILFKQIPEIAGSAYTFQPIYQKKFTDICFYSNPKTGLYEQFINILGETEGRPFYKKFELYMREKELHSYEDFWQEKHSDESLLSNPVIAEARHLIERRAEGSKVDLSTRSSG